MRSRHAGYWLAFIVAVAAVARFSTLGGQAFWFDEFATVRNIGPGFLDAMRGVETTSNPPLYYGIAWAWERLFGSGEVGLRSLSALLGTATVPVAYAAACALGSRRAGLIAAALIATNPMLIWYSQEARNYALVVFLAALAFLFFVLALKEGRRRWLWGWGIASGLALATHYFALAVVAPQAGWLLLTALRERALRVHAALCTALVGAVGLALVPLLSAQREAGSAGWVGLVDRPARIAQVPAHLLSGLSVPWRIVPLVVGVALGASVVYALVRAGPATRRAFALAAGVGLAGLVVAIVPSFFGFDYILSRNALALLPALAVAAAVALGARAAGLVGPAAAAGICLVWLALAVWTAATPAAQRADWDRLAEALAEPRDARVVALGGQYAGAPFLFYADGARPVDPEDEVAASELVLVAPRPVSDYGLGPCWWGGLCGGHALLGGDGEPPLEAPGRFELVEEGSTERLDYRVFSADSSVAIPVEETAIWDVLIQDPG